MWALVIVAFMMVPGLAKPEPAVQAVAAFTNKAECIKARTQIREDAKENIGASVTKYGVDCVFVELTTTVKDPK